MHILQLQVAVCCVWWGHTYRKNYAVSNGVSVPFARVEMHYINTQSHTFQNGSLGVTEAGLQQVGILCWDDGVLREAAMQCSFTVSKLVKILADMLQV